MLLIGLYLNFNETQPLLPSCYFFDSWMGGDWMREKRGTRGVMGREASTLSHPIFSHSKAQ